MTTYADGCAGCAISQGLLPVTGGIVKLSGDWIINQYGGSEGFLGWLALQPRFHRMGLSQLTHDELHSLGPNIRELDLCLTHYWHLQYPADPVARVYVIYFFEDEFREPPALEPFHLHIHIIPRFQSLGTDERLRRTENDVKWVDGWRVPALALEQKVPGPYDRRSPRWQTRASNLMAYLRHELSARP